MVFYIFSFSDHYHVTSGHISLCMPSTLVTYLDASDMPSSSLSLSVSLAASITSSITLYLVYVTLGVIYGTRLISRYLINHVPLQFQCILIGINDRNVI